ncbi:MAG TPA: AlpA family phage regulatory protein [Lichenihabitans sp.]|nr:AlpA family phage regulatory protein [Lichenihabitans sp.]
MTDANQTPKPTLPELQPLQMLGIAEVKSLLQVSTSTVYRWIDQGSFPRPFQLSENCVRWRAVEIQAWLEARPPFSKPGMKPGTSDNAEKNKAA